MRRDCTYLQMVDGVLETGLIWRQWRTFGAGLDTPITKGWLAGAGEGGAERRF
jgi:hypothetical protein